jgi:hypothetical protein
MKQKYLKRGIPAETEQLGYLRSEIEALESATSLPKPEPTRTRSTPDSATTSDLGAILEQTIAKLEAAMLAAPKEQRPDFEGKLRLLRGQVQAFRHKAQSNPNPGSS